MLNTIGKSRVVLLLMLPVTIPVLWIVLKLPFKFIETALSEFVMPGLIDGAGSVFGLLGAIAIHIKMWRSLKPSDANNQRSV